MSLLETLITLDFRQKTTILEIEYLQQRLALIDEKRNKNDYIIISSQLEGLNEKYKLILEEQKEAKTRARGLFKISE